MKLFKSFLTALLCLLALNFNARAEKGFIYVHGAGGYYAPTTENADKFENYRLFETEEGSGVYEGDINFFMTYDYFRFYTALSDPDDGNSYSKNVICSHRDREADEQPKQIGKSGVYFMDSFEMTKGVSYNNKSWKLPEGDNYTRKWHFKVDTKKKNFYMCPSVEAMVVWGNDNTTPTLETAANYTSINRINDTYDFESKEFRLYSPFYQKWMDADNKNITPSGTVNLKISNVDSKPEPIKIGKFKGVMSAQMTPNARITFTFNADNGVADQTDCMYVVFDNNPPTTLAPGATTTATSLFTRLDRQPDGSYEGEIYHKAGNFCINFISGAPDYKTIVPVTGTDCPINLKDRFYFSRIAEAAPGATAAFTIKDWKDGNIKIKIHNGDDPYVSFQNMNIKNEIYLIGTPQDWNVNNGNMPLKLTSNGGFYGEYEIPANPSFRFYTNLGDWDREYSLGAQWDDFTELDISKSIYPGSYDYEVPLVVRGQGNYHITDWTGGKMYFYVRPNESCAIFSSEPISSSVTGYVLSDEVEYKPTNGLFYSFANENAINSATRLSDNVYLLQADPLTSISLTSKHLSIPDEYKEAKGSYALQFESTDLNFDDRGVAVLDFTIRDRVTSEAPQTITFPEMDTYNRAYSINYYDLPYGVLVDFNKGKMYVEKKGMHQYFGKTSEPLNYSNYQKATIVPNSGGIVSVAGARDSEFYLIRSIFDALTQQYTPEEITLDADGFAKTTSWLGFSKKFRFTNLQSDNVFVSPDLMADMSKVDYLTATDWFAEGYDNIVKLTRENKNSFVYKGKITLREHPDSQDIFEVPYVSILLGNLALGPNSSLSSDTKSYRAIAPDTEGRFSRKIARNISLMFPGMKAGTEISFEVDLANLIINGYINPKSFNRLNEVILSSGESFSLLPELRGNENLVVGSTQLSSLSTGNIRFNITTPDGKVIIPLSDGEKIKFNSEGFWEGSYTTTTPLSTNTKHAAENASKWEIDMGKFPTSQVHFMIDTEHSKIKLFSVEHAQDIRVYQTTEKYYYATMASNPVGVLRYHPSDNTYRGNVKVEGDSDSFYLGFFGEIHTYTYMQTRWDNRISLSFYNSGSQEINVGYDGAVAELPAEMSYMGGTLLVNSPIRHFNVMYDPEMRVLVVTGTNSVDEISEESTDALKVIPGTGYVEIYSSENRNVEVYSITGIHAATLNVPQGNSRHNIPTGFYIIGNAKVMVK